MDIKVYLSILVLSPRCLTVVNDVQPRGRGRPKVNAGDVSARVPRVSHCDRHARLSPSLMPLVSWLSSAAE